MSIVYCCACYSYSHNVFVMFPLMSAPSLCLQDLVGEAPIHKAARSGSVECIQVLLVAGAKAQ